MMSVQYQINTRLAWNEKIWMIVLSVIFLYILPAALMFGLSFFVPEWFLGVIPIVYMAGLAAIVLTYLM